MSHAAEGSSRTPQAPIGTAVPTAQDASAQIHHNIPDKSGSAAAVSDASARGTTTSKAGKTSASNGGLGGVPSGAVGSGTPAYSRSASNNGAGSQQYTREAQQIVEEERAASEKLPVYSGLQDRFILLSKMGDGAFSNVYKARDKKTGQKVAIKVVRKYELNSNQVSSAACGGEARRVGQGYACARRAVSCRVVPCRSRRKLRSSLPFPVRLAAADDWRRHHAMSRHAAARHRTPLGLLPRMPAHPHSNRPLKTLAHQPPGRCASGCPP